MEYDRNYIYMTRIKVKEEIVVKKRIDVMDENI